MNHQDLINTCVFEQFQWLLFSDLSGPLKQISDFTPKLISMVKHTAAGTGPAGLMLTC